MKRFALTMMTIALISLPTLYFQYDAWNAYLNHWATWGIVVTMLLSWGTEMLHGLKQAERHKDFVWFVKYRLVSDHTQRQKIADDTLTQLAIAVNDATNRLIAFQKEGLKGGGDIWARDRVGNLSSEQIARDFEEMLANLERDLRNTKERFSNCYDEFWLYSKDILIRLRQKNWENYLPEELRKTA